VTVATTIDREVQVEPRRRGIGTRIDLTVTTPAATHPATAPRVIAEAKLVTNDTLMTAMQDQLIGRYLIPEALQYGIYLIYWIPARQRQRRKRTHTDPAQLLRQLEQQAASAGPDLHIKPFLLDKPTGRRKGCELGNPYEACCFVLPLALRVLITGWGLRWCGSTRSTWRVHRR